MTKDNIRMNDLKIYSSSTGREYVKMMVPEGWTITIDRYEDWYGGSIYPYVFRITESSPDKRCSIYYYSPFCFIEDELNEYPEGCIDENGELHCTASSLEDYLDSRVRQRFNEEDGLTFIRHIPFSSNDRRSREIFDSCLEEEKERGLILGSLYYSRGISIYTYRKEDGLHYFVTSAFLEAKDLIRWSVIEEEGLSEKQLAERYPGCCYDEENDRYVYPSVHRIEWEIGQYLEMDCPEEDYEVVYSEIFVPVVKSGVLLLDDAWDEYRRMIDEKKADNAEVDPEEQRKIDAVWAEYRRWKTDLDQQTYNYVRNSQDSINDTLNSSYHDSQAIHDRLNQGWSDTFMGNSRFIDRVGREHVIHTSDNYAYKRGNVYVTTNSSLEKPYDFEELVKKKY